MNWESHFQLIIILYSRVHTVRERNAHTQTHRTNNHKEIKANKEHQEIIQVYPIMTTSCSYRCSSTIMVKNYKDWLHNWVSTPNLTSLSNLTRVFSLFFFLKNWYSQCPYMPKTSSFYSYKETPNKKGKNYNFQISCEIWLGRRNAEFLSWCRNFASRAPSKGILIDSAPFLNNLPLGD